MVISLNMLLINGLILLLYYRCAHPIVYFYSKSVKPRDADLLLPYPWKNHGQNGGVVESHQFLHWEKALLHVRLHIKNHFIVIEFVVAYVTEPTYVNISEIVTSDSLYFFSSGQMV